MTQAEAADWNKGGGGFDPNAIIQAPNIPTRIYSLPRSTGAALLALLYAPDATPSS